MFRLGALVFGLLLGVVAAEVTVRLAGIEPPRLISKRRLTEQGQAATSYYHCYPDNPHGEFQPLPDTTQGSWELHAYTFERSLLPLSELSRTPWCVSYQISPQGLRDQRDYSVPPPPDTLRIAVIGDSFVFGEGVREADTLPRQLEREAGEGFEWVNGGQIGANTEQETAILDQVVRGTGATRALLVFIANDVVITPELAARQTYINDLIQIRDAYLDRERNRPWYAGRLRLLDLARAPWTMQAIQHDTIEWYRDSYDPRHNGPNLEILHLEFAKLAQRSDCRTLLVLYPLLEGLDGNYPLQSVHDMVTHIANEAGLPVLDLTPAFGGRQARDLWVHETDHHPNRLAHQIAAQAILADLHRDFPEFLELDRPGTRSLPSRSQ